MSEPTRISDTSEETDWPRFSLFQAIVLVTAFCVAMAIATSFLSLWSALVGSVFGLCLIVAGVYRRSIIFGLAGGVVLLLVLLNSETMIGSLRRTLPCIIQVSDDETGRPIAGVNVRIRDISLHDRPEGVPVHPIPNGERGVSQVTDARGSVVLPCEFSGTRRSNLFVEEESIYVSPYLWIQVEAPGYERALVRMDSFTGSTGNWKQGELPVMRIRLTPSGAAANAR